MDLLGRVTHSLEPFIKTRASALIGEECYKKLAEEFNIFDPVCLKLAISKMLGIGIVLGGSIVKVPQLIKVLSSKSGRGISILSYLFETAAMVIGVAYSTRHGFSFSTFGEGLFISIQNILITLLIAYFAKKKTLLLSLILLMIAGCYSVFTTSLSTLTILQASTIPLALLSKIFQISTNFRKQSTGQLSAFTVFNYLLGSFARVFTTIVEVNDPLVLWGYVLTAVLNALLALQMVVYWKPRKKIKVKSKSS